MVDFLLELAKVTEKKVSREELYKAGRRSGRGLTAGSLLALGHRRK